MRRPAVLLRRFLGAAAAPPLGRPWVRKSGWGSVTCYVLVASLCILASLTEAAIVVNGAQRTASREDPETGTQVSVSVFSASLEETQRSSSACLEEDEDLIISLDLSLTGGSRISAALANDDAGRQVFTTNYLDLDEAETDVMLHLCPAPSRVFDYEPLAEADELTQTYTLRLQSSLVEPDALVDIELTLTNADEGRPQIFEDQTRRVREQTFADSPEVEDDEEREALVGVRLVTINDDSDEGVTLFGERDKVSGFQIGRIRVTRPDNAQYELGSDTDAEEDADIKPFTIDESGQISVRATLVSGSEETEDEVFDYTPLTEGCGFGGPNAIPLSSRREPCVYNLIVRAKDDVPMDQWGDYAIVSVTVVPSPDLPEIRPALRSLREGSDAFDNNGLLLIGGPLEVLNVDAPEDAVLTLISVTAIGAGSAGRETVTEADQMPFVITADRQVAFRRIPGRFEALDHESYPEFTLQVQAAVVDGAVLLSGRSTTIQVLIENVDETPVLADKSGDPASISQILGGIDTDPVTGRSLTPLGTRFGTSVFRGADDPADSRGLPDEDERALRFSIDPSVPDHTPNAEITFNIDPRSGRLLVREGQLTAVGAYSIGVRVEDWDVCGESDAGCISDAEDSDTALITLGVGQDFAPRFEASEALIEMPDPPPEDEGLIGRRITAAEVEGERLRYSIVRVTLPVDLPVGRLPFEVEEDSGQISVETTENTLNPNARYQFTVRATDFEGIQEKYAEIEVIIAREFEERPPVVLPVRPRAIDEGASGPVGEPLAFSGTYGDEVTSWRITGVKAGGETAREATPYPFTITVVGQTGQLRVAEGKVPDYESLPEGEKFYTVSVIVSAINPDRQTAQEMTSAPEHFRIYIRDVDEQPVFAQSDYVLAISGVQNGDLVGVVQAEDPEGDAVIHEIVRVSQPDSISSPDGLPFSVAEVDGSILVTAGAGRAALADARVYEFTVRATSRSGSADVQVIVNADPEAPRFLGPELIAFREGGSNAEVPLSAVLDQGDSAALRWEVVPADDFFIIGPTTGLLALGSGVNPFDLELLDFDIVTPGQQTSREIGVQVCNAGVSPPKCDSAQVIVEVRPRPRTDSLVFAADSYSRSVTEDAPDGFVLGAPIAVTDPTLLVAYSISQGAPFIINSATGQVWVKLDQGYSLDFEILQDYEITITATEKTAAGGDTGRSASATLRITVTDVDDVHPEVLSDQQFSVSVGAVSGTEVGRVEVTDVDSDSFSYQIDPAPSPASPFTVDPQSGAILVASVGSPVPADPPSYRPKIIVTDEGGNSSEPTPVTIEVESGSAGGERRRELQTLSRAAAVSSASLLVETLRPQMSPTEFALFQGMEDFSTAAASFVAQFHRRQQDSAQQGIPSLGLRIPLRSFTIEPLDEEEEAKRPKPSYTFWLRTGERRLSEGQAGLEHGSMDFEGSTWAVSLGLERRLAHRYQVGLSVTHSESDFPYQVRPRAGPVTEGRYQEMMRTLGVYGIARPASNFRLWVLLGAGLGDIRDVRDVNDSQELGNADASQYLGAFGADYSLAFGNIDHPLEVSIKSSAYGLRKVTGEVRYEGVPGAVTAPKGTDTLYEFRLGFRAGIPLALWGSFVKPYLGVDLLRHSGDYHLDDSSAYDIISGLEWRGRRLSLAMEGNLEVDQDGQDLWGMRADFRYLSQERGAGPQLRLTTDRGVIGGALDLDTDRLGESFGLPESGSGAAPWRLVMEGAWGLASLRGSGALWTPYARLEPRIDAGASLFALGLRLRGVTTGNWRGDLRLGYGQARPGLGYQAQIRCDFRMRF